MEDKRILREIEKLKNRLDIIDSKLEHIINGLNLNVYINPTTITKDLKYDGTEVDVEETLIPSTDKKKK